MESSNKTVCLEHVFMRRMAESVEGRREKENVILLTHPLILGLLKHLVLFSEDTVEKDGLILEKDEKQGLTTVTQFYVPSIEKIETLDCTRTLKDFKGLQIILRRLS